MGDHSSFLVRVSAELTGPGAPECHRDAYFQAGLDGVPVRGMSVAKSSVLSLPSCAVGMSGKKATDPTPVPEHVWGLSHRPRLRDGACPIKPGQTVKLA